MRREDVGSKLKDNAIWAIALCAIWHMGIDVSEEPALLMVVVRFFETLEPIYTTTAHNPEDHNVDLTFRIWIRKDRHKHLGETVSKK
jgi:hypothetical protein